MFKNKWYMLQRYAVPLMLLAATLISVCLYPEVFLTFKTSFILWYDYVEEYFMTFILSNFINQGTVPLWDHFGQMPLTYSFVTFGFFKFQNVVTALLFNGLAPFSDHTGQFFHHVFAWGNILSHLFLRITGIYLLLQCLGVNQRLVIVGTVIFSVFYSQPAFLWGTYMMSFYPLLMYCVVKFFQDYKLKYILAYVLLYAISIGNGMVYLGALHLGMHFFVLACLIWACVYRKDGWGLWKSTWVKATFSSRWLPIIGVSILIGLIVGPYIFILLNGLNEVAFGQDQSRVSQPFDLNFYFNHLELSLANAKRFITDTLNFIEYGNPTVFFGWMIYFWAAIGVVFSRQSIKWAFVLAIVFIWLINFPRQEMSIGLIGHWINALTNPLKTIPRSYLVVSYTMLSYLLMPLAIFGLEAMFNKIREDSSRDKKRWYIILIVMASVAFTSLKSYPSVVSWQLGLCLSLCGFFIIWHLIKPTLISRQWMLGVFLALTLVDMTLVVYQTKKRFVDESALNPAVFDGLSTTGLVDYNHMNPLYTPWREYAIDDFSFLDENRLWNFRGLTSNYYHVTNHGLNFLYTNGHSPRHISYGSWAKAPIWHAYLNQSTRVLMRVSEAVMASPGLFDKMVKANLVNQVVVVQDQSGALHLPTVLPDAPLPIVPERRSYKEITYPVNDWVNGVTFNVVDDLVILRFKLPSDFPKHLSTTWFTQDRQYLHFLAQIPNKQWVEFKPTQGEIVNSFMYDVQNIHEGILYASFPKQQFQAGSLFKFIYAVDTNEGVRRVWLMQYDRVGVDYRAARNGWCVLHYPYSPRWRITVDGKRTAYYKANESFIGFPITQGDHRILIEYWPQTSLRFWLGLSGVLTTLSLLAVIIVALYWQRRQQRQGQDHD